MPPAPGSDDISHKRAGQSVELAHAVESEVRDQQIAIRTELQIGVSRAPDTGEHPDETAARAVVSQNLRRVRTGDIQVPVRSEGDSVGSIQTATASTDHSTE